MSEINNLVYFLNSIKDLLPFEDKNDFAKKINENKDFRIKVQKLVYLSKFFGWDNPFIFTLAERGPYSVELKQAYSMDNLFENLPEKINGFDLSAIRNFIKNQNLLFIEASATILYQSNDEISEEDCITSIHSLKQHISPDIISDAYKSIGNFQLYNKTILHTDEINNLKNQINIRIKKLTDDFEKFEPYTNQIMVTGTMDYMRIALRESDLNLNDTYDLIMFIDRYLDIIEQLFNQITSEEEFIYMDLGHLEEIFNQFQDFVSEEHHIIKRIDDNDFDEKLFY
jgi:uncharacterized protein YwgA